MDIKEICKQRWECIGELEKEFLKEPSQNNGLTLNSLWENWLLEDWVKSNMSGAIAGPRLDLFNKYINCGVDEEEVVDYLQKNPLPEFDYEH